MDAVDVLNELRSNGITVRLEDGKLRYRSVAGAYTSELRALVDEHRDDIIEHLESLVPVTLYQPMRCNDCGVEGMTVYLGMADGSDICHSCWTRRQAGDR